MQALAYKQPQINITSFEDQLYNILKTNLWHECSHDIKRIYDSIKSNITEDEQSDILIFIYNNTLCNDGITEYWKYMNR